MMMIKKIRNKTQIKIRKIIKKIRTQIYFNNQILKTKPISRNYRTNNNNQILVINLYSDRIKIKNHLIKFLVKIKKNKIQQTLFLDKIKIKKNKIQQTLFLVKNKIKNKRVIIKTN